MAEKSNYKIAVLGSGAFGTAISQVATFKDFNHVVIWSIDEEPVKSINEKHKNSEIFSETTLNKNISATNDLKEALKDASLILNCLPAQVIADFLEKNKDNIPLDIPFVSCSKGMVVEREKFISEVANDILQGKLRYCALSGPSFAQETIDKNPTLVTIASKDKEARELAQKILSSTYFRAYTHDDVLGVEIAGAMKNILAIGVGVLEGLGYKTNTLAAFITRGIKEVQSFIKAYGADPQTFFGLSGIGDLILTCLGQESRNKKFGIRIGEGKDIDEAVKASEGVVEGLPTLEVVIKYAKQNNVSLPLITVLNEYLHGDIKEKEALHKLMDKELESEW